MRAVPFSRPQRPPLLQPARAQADNAGAMFRSLVDQWKRRREAGSSRFSAGPTVRVDRRGPPVHAAAPTAIGARRPLISAKGRLVGFEFCLAEATLARLRRWEDEPTAYEHALALFTSMRIATDAGRLAYTELPVGWLERLPATIAIAPGMLIGVPQIDAMGEFTPESCSAILAMRAVGAKVGWTGDFPRAFGPDFLLLPFFAGAAEGNPAHQVEHRIHKAARHRLPVLATGIAHIDDLDDAVRNGAAHVACAIPSHYEPEQPLPISPRVQRVCQLLNRLMRDDDTPVIAADIKSDVGLSYRLLNYLNMAGVGMMSRIGSIEQAVALLGRNELYRWLAMLMVSHASTRPTAAALQEVTLARARLLELLAIDRGEAQPGGLFMLGLTSMLGLLLDARLDDAVAQLHLPDAARNALLLHEGPWVEYLAMARHLDDPNPLVVQAMAERFGGIEQVMQRAAEAWHWAAAMGRGD